MRHDPTGGPDATPTEDPSPDQPLATRDEDPHGDDLAELSGDDADAPADTGRPADDEATA